MDDAHHDAIHSHRVYSLQAVERRLNHHGTMMGNLVMMMVIHTLRLTQDDRSEAKDDSAAAQPITRADGTSFVHVHHWPRLADNEISQPRSVIVCHPERSEGSLTMGRRMLRFAQHDRTGFDRELLFRVVRLILPLEIGSFSYVSNGESIYMRYAVVHRM